MSIRTETQIENIVAKAKSNMFAKMMDYGGQLSLGTAVLPSFERQSNLIWACQCELSSLEQKNAFADEIGNLRMDLTKQDGYVEQGYWSLTY